MPASCERKSSSNKAKADDHIPSPDVRDWVARARDVEDNDPDQTCEEGGDHCWGEPSGRLLEEICMLEMLGYLLEMVLLSNLLADLGFRHGARLLQNRRELAGVQER